MSYSTHVLQELRVQMALFAVLFISAVGTDNEAALKDLCRFKQMFLMTGGSRFKQRAH